MGLWNPCGGSYDTSCCHGLREAWRSLRKTSSQRDRGHQPYHPAPSAARAAYMKHAKLPIPVVEPGVAHGAFDWSSGSFPTPGLGGWSAGQATYFQLRNGPNYLKNRRKSMPPRPPLYKCIGADVVRGSRPIGCAIANLGDVVPLDGPSSENLENFRRARMAGQPLPETLLINFQLPYEAGPLFGPHPQEDAGCSVLMVFKLDPEEANHPQALAARALRKYLAEPGHPFKEGFAVSRCLKVVGLIEDVEKLDIPSSMLPLVRKFNGKPVLIEKECRRYYIEDRDLLELNIDVRGFNPVARTLLAKLRDQLTRCTINLGVLLQGCSDEELPEQLLGSVNLESLDMINAAKIALGDAEDYDDEGRYASGSGNFSGPAMVQQDAWWSSIFQNVLRPLMGCPSRRQPAEVRFQVESVWCTPRSSFSGSS